MCELDRVHGNLSLYVHGGAGVLGYRAVVGDGEERLRRVIDE